MYHKLKNDLSKDDLLFIDNMFTKHNADFTSVLMLNGFFTALICAPTLIMPSKYLPVIWGKNNEPNYESIEEAMLFHEITNILWNDIANMLYTNQTFTFSCSINTKNDLMDWLEGFLQATTCVPRDWKILHDDEEYCSLLALIATLYQKYLSPDIISIDQDDVLSLKKRYHVFTSIFHQCVQAFQTNQVLF